MNHKTRTIVYWVATCWLALGMVSTGMVQLAGNKEEISNFKHLGYPIYLMVLLGVWKLLGSAVVLLPGLRLLKEWAYAGFFFAMTGAAFSRLYMGDPVVQIFPSLLLLCLTVVSWYFRPQQRKAIAQNL